MTSFLPQRTSHTLVGLSLEEGRLAVSVVRRTNGSVEIRESFSAALSLPTLSGDPALVGRELRQHLDQHRVRERRCVVCLPSSWVLSLQVPLPDLPEPDLQDLLQLEAERGFPTSTDALILATSRFRTPAGQRYATILAISRDTIARLESVLAAAQLRPLSFCPSVLALPTPAAATAAPELALSLAGERLSLRVWAGGGLVILRNLEGVFEHDGPEPQLQVDTLLRELRITLGQLPSDIRDSLRRVRVFGSDDATEELFETLQSRLADGSKETVLTRTYGPTDTPLQVPAGTLVTSAISLATCHLAGLGSPLEFLPPKVSAWKRLSTQYASRRLAWAGAAALSLALIVGGAFLVQQLQLWRWDSRWQAMAAEVKELESVQQRIRQYRPWFDDSFRSLAVLRRLTEAFPEDSSVSAKTIEMRGPSLVFCSGTAQDRPALIQALDKLRTAPEVHNVKVEQLRGRSPVEYTFNFQWTPTGNP